MAFTLKISDLKKMFFVLFYQEQAETNWTWWHNSIMTTVYAI